MAPKQKDEVFIVYREDGIHGLNNQCPYRAYQWGSARAISETPEGLGEKLAKYIFEKRGPEPGHTQIAGMPPLEQGVTISFEAPGTTMTRISFLTDETPPFNHTFGTTYGVAVRKTCALTEQDRDKFEGALAASLDELLQSRYIKTTK